MPFPLFVLTSSAIAVATAGGVLACADRRPLAIIVAFFGATALLIVHGPIYFDYYADDAFITLRYSTHLAQGLGPDWNSEGHVEGYTTFLWMGVLAGFAKLGFDIVDVSRYLGFASLLATFGAVYLIWNLWSRERPDSGIASPVLLAVVFLGLALVDGVAFWGFSGMETPLFTALVTFSAYRYLIERRSQGVPWSAVALAATAMTRPEGLIVVAVTGAFVLFDAATASDRRRAMLWAGSWAAVFIGLYGSYFLWRYTYYDYLLPNTYYAKVGLNLDALDRGLRYVTTSGLQYHLGILFVGSALLLAEPRWRRDATYIIVLTGAMLAAVVLEGGDSHGRFIVPIMPLLLIAGLSGFATLFKRASLPRAHFAMISASALVFGGLSLLPASYDPLVPLGPRAIEQRRTLGTWFNTNTPSDYVIADFAIGAVAYYASDRDFLDLLGLNDVVIAHTEIPSMGRGIVGHEKYNADYVYDEVRPEIIVVGQSRREPLSKGELQQVIGETSLFSASYVLLSDARLWERYEARAFRVGDRWIHFMQRQDTIGDLQTSGLR